MTRAEAAIEARRRYGPQARAILYPARKGAPRECVVMVRYGVDGRGPSFEAAFAEADRREGRRENPLLERLVGADRVQELVMQFGSIRRVLDAPLEELKAARVPAKAIRAIIDAREGRQDYLEAQTTEGGKITTPEGLMRWFRPRLEHLDQEEFWVAAFDGKNKPIRTYMVSRGLTNASLVGPKETFAHIVRLKATAFACAHNHPSGDPTPSVEDVELTKRLQAAADILGVRFLDHIIITVNGYTSFMERGLMQSPGRIGR